MATSDAPVQIGHVTLTVHDLDRMSDFYEQVLGLARMEKHTDVAVLGAGGLPLIRLEQDKAARISRPTEAGLFHTAFLMPSRADLAAWLDHAVALRPAMQGASDHAVSEAIYLGDPEGNGIEVYVDRPREEWPIEGDEIAMVTDPLDLQDLRSAKQSDWTGAPDEMTVGHVHLRVGSLAPADDFYGGVLGMRRTSTYPGAHFYAAGEYHHHIAGNIWNSRGAPVRDGTATGLTGLTLLADADEFDRVTARAEGPLTDPWGLPITLERKKA